MMYSVNDLAEDLGITRREIYKLLPAGLPHAKDANGHICIHGLEAAKWIIEHSKGKRFTLADDQAYCLRCDKAVVMVGPKRRKSGKMTLLQGMCPLCGATVNRGIKNR